MRTQRYTAAVLVIACVGLASTASAQERHRFWFEFDGGIASAHVSAGNFDDSRGWTGGGGLALGWTVNPRLLAGIDLRVEPLNIVGPIEGEVGMYLVGARLAYYPSPSRGFFVKGTIGGSFLDLSYEESGTTLTAEIGKGLGLGGGVGYDWYLGRGFSLTPSVTYWYGRTGDFRFAGQTFFPDWRHDIVDLTIGVSFH